MEALRAANRGMARAVCQGAKTAKRYAALGAGMEVDAQGYGREPTAMVRGVLSCLFVCLFVPNRYYPNVFFTSREEGASPVSGRGREPVSGKLGGFSWAFTQERRTGEGCGPFREKQACRFSVNILFVCLFVCFSNPFTRFFRRLLFLD